MQDNAETPTDESQQASDVPATPPPVVADPTPAEPAPPAADAAQSQPDQSQPDQTQPAEPAASEAPPVTEETSATRAPAQEPVAAADAATADQVASDSAAPDQAVETTGPTPAAPASDPVPPAAQVVPPAAPAGAQAPASPEAPVASDQAGTEEPAGEQVDMGQLLEGEAGSAAPDAKVGDRVSGVLVRIGDENSFIDFGGRSEGMLATNELKGEDGEFAFAVGEPLEAFVVSAADEVRLSRFLKGEDREADMLYKAFKSGTPIEGRVMAVNKWGLGVELAGTRAFCPISQIDTAFVQNPEEYRDKKLQFKIIRFRDRGRSIVLSRRALLEADQEKQATTVRAQIVANAILTGTVTRLEDFGAFVDLGHGVEGLVHVSEMKHERVGHPQEVVESGQEVKVKVLDVKSLGSRRKERISLSIKALEADPWGDVRAQFPQGSVVMGKVESIESYGAFVELAENVRGLVHVSEMADRRVNHPRDVVSVGEEVKVAVVELDNRRKRLRLSIKRAEQVEGEANLKEFTDRQKREQEEAGGANSAMLDALKRAQLID